jgi:hypothetical protein
MLDLKVESNEFSHLLQRREAPHTRWILHSGVEQANLQDHRPSWIPTGTPWC